VRTPGSMEVIQLGADSNAGWSDEPALGRIFASRPGAHGDWRLAKVCQVCGDLAAVKCWEEWCAAHVEGAEFKGFRGHHQQCQEVAPGALAARSYRFCEICRGTVWHVAERRIGLSWVCPACELGVRQTGHDPQLILEDVARARFERCARIPPTSAPAKIHAIGWPQAERVRPPVDWLPPGLYRCPDCSQVRGLAWAPAAGGGLTHWRSVCICDGMTCRRCAINRIRRPISDYYNPRDGMFWHVPYFVGMAPCRECRAEDA
jgi:hypothetical protein